MGNDDEFRHYLPVMYLKYFGDKKHNSNIYVADINKNEILFSGGSTSKKSPFGSKDFYNDKNEYLLSHDIERNCGNLLKNLWLQKPYDNDNVIQNLLEFDIEFANFCSILWHRNISNRDLFLNVDLKKLIDEAYSLHFRRNFIKGLHFLNYNEVLDNYEKYLDLNNTDICLTDIDIKNNYFNRKLKEDISNVKNNDKDIIKEFIIKSLRNKMVYLEWDEQSEMINIDNPIILIGNYNHVQQESEIMKVINMGNEINEIIITINNKMRLYLYSEERKNSLIYFDDFIKFQINNKNTNTKFNYFKYIFSSNRSKVEELIKL